jgi:hypothetical protein
MYPGRVSSAERAPPPTVSAASKTITDRPALAKVMAAANPLGPDPTTTPSYLEFEVKKIGRLLRIQPFCYAGTLV